MQEPLSMTDLSEGMAFIQGEYCPIAEAKIPILDQAVMTSDGTYDALHVWNGAFFRLDDHLDRLERSTQRLRLKIPYEREALVGILMELVRRSGMRDCFLEIIVSRGVARPAVRDIDLYTNQLYTFVLPYFDFATPTQRERGLHLQISSVERTSTRSNDSTIKNFSRLDFILAELETKDKGADRALLLDEDGHVTEGHGYNLFALCGGTLLTPASGVLEGISRRTVLELCKETNLKAEECAFIADQLYAADEVLITSSAGGVIPVTRVDDKSIGGGQPGPVTQRLHDMYWAMHDDPKYATPVDYAA